MEVNTFSDRDCERIAGVVRYVESKVPIAFERRPPPVPDPVVRLVHFKSKSGGIPAYNSGTGIMGSASCDIYKSSSTGALTDSGADETIYNAHAAFGANKMGTAIRNGAGLLVAVTESC